MDALVQEMPLSIGGYKDKKDFLAAQNDYVGLVDGGKPWVTLQSCSLRDNHTCAILPVRELRTWPTQACHPLKVVCTLPYGVQWLLLCIVIIYISPWGFT